MSKAFVYNDQINLLSFRPLESLHKRPIFVLGKVVTFGVLKLFLAKKMKDQVGSNLMSEALCNITLRVPLKKREACGHF